MLVFCSRSDDTNIIKYACAQVYIKESVTNKIAVSKQILGIKLENQGNTSMQSPEQPENTSCISKIHFVEKALSNINLQCVCFI